MKWKPLDNTVKDGRLLLLGNPEHLSGPYLGYWWKFGNCMVSAGLPWITHPTHCVDISELSFK